MPHKPMKRSKALEIAMEALQPWGYTPDDQQDAAYDTLDTMLTEELEKEGLDHSSLAKGTFRPPEASR